MPDGTREAPQQPGEGIAAALARAQAKMGRAAKSANNPHFKRTYADLADVMDACMPALSAEGIAVTQPVRREDGSLVLYTILHHGASGETLDDGGMPLIVNKNDMQGLGSALTYARRYGLMAMTGIAPDDDDGNAAASAPPPKQAQRPAFDARRAADRIITEINRADTLEALGNLWTGAAEDLRQIKAADPSTFAEVEKAKDDRKAALTPAEQPAGDAPTYPDEIPL